MDGLSAPSCACFSPAALEYMSGVYRSAGIVIPDGAQTMAFHDLGLYEFLFLSLVVPLFLLWDRVRQRHGFYLVAFAALYLPVRFWLDTLRVADVRYFGLMPAQWVASLIMTVLPFAVVRHRKLGLTIAAAVILAAGWACAAAR